MIFASVGSWVRAWAWAWAWAWAGTQVGRIRQNIVFGDNGLEFFVCGDQLLRGAVIF
jgi:aspartate-semialdehyde dehydrogenase